MATFIGLPAALRVIWAEIEPLIHSQQWPFWLGFAGILALWAAWWRHTRWARFITTIEHESLHAIVGMLSLIPVRELKVREDGSGHVLFEPPGHWLLYLSPYFIPLLLLIEVGLIGLMGLPDDAERALLGALLGLSWWATCAKSTLGKQTFARQAGYLLLPFCPRHSCSPTGQHSPCYKVVNWGPYPASSATGGERY